LKYIDSTEIQEKLPEGWEDKAKEAYETVLAVSPEGRSGAINRFSHLWTQLKDILHSHFHGKCWYCEAIQERSDNAVDHFRPKNKVFECPKHGGYWWLAFKWLNYRYSCTFCNSRRLNKDGVAGGKHDHFPLEEEQKRAYTPEDDLDAEQPLLLDPTCPADPGLLWFDEDGQADRLPLRLKGQVDVVPRPPVVLSVPDANIIGPLGRLHEQHHVAVSNRNILQPRLPLACVPGMFLQRRFHLLYSLRTLLE
jgi:hypothetical protein